MATTGHEQEAINVQGLKASLQKLKTDHIDGKADKATTLAGYGITDTYTKTEVNGLVDTPHQNYVTVAATSQTTAATDVLPASGQSADTIYRVSNWDGSANSGAGAFDATCYSEYAWDDTSNPNKYVFLCVKSQIGEVFDISVYNNNAKYADLAAALNGGANIPQSLQKGGMSVKFVQSSDNKYVQYRYMSSSTAAADFTNVANWQGVDDEPTAGSRNLVESGGVWAGQTSIEQHINGIIDSGTIYNTLDQKFNRVCVFYPIADKDATYRIDVTDINPDNRTINIAYRSDATPYVATRLGDIPNGQNFTIPNNIKDQVKYIGVACLSPGVQVSFKVRLERVGSVEAHLNANETAISTIASSQSVANNLLMSSDRNVEYVHLSSQLGAYIENNSVWITAKGFGLIVSKGRSYYYIGGVTECGFELGDKQFLLIDINYLITNGTRGAFNSPNDVMVLMSGLDYSNLENKNNYVIFAERQINKTFFVGKANDMFGVSPKDQPSYETYVLRKTIPSYYFSSPADAANLSENEYLEKKIGIVSGKSGKSFIYFADTHWTGYSWTGSQGIDYEGISTPLMIYCKNRLNINNVIFGGDVLYQDMTQKNALLLAKRFMNNVRAAFGNELLFTRGNHDLNALHGSEWHQDSLLTYDMTFPIYNKNTNVVFDGELESKINAKGYNADKTRELVCFARGHYYKDDKENKIRYIVLDTGAQLGNTNAAWGVLGNGFPVLQLQYNFLYNALNTLPEYTVNDVTKSYDVVVSAHYFIDYRNGYFVTDPSVLQICKILSAFKAGGTIDKNSLYYGTYSAGDAPGAGDNRKELDNAPDMDFSSRSSVGKVFVIVGDSHHDTAVICQTVDNEYTSVRYNDELVQQDDAILIINTKCEVCGGTTSDPSIEGVYSYQNSAADYGTINETSFDIVTFNDEHVYCIRVGLGIDRTFNY